MKQQAFVLRISPSGNDRIPEALSSNQIIIGWAKARGLLDEKLSWGEFREILRRTYYPTKENLRKAGAAAGHMWRFVRDMQVGDLVVVPYGSKVYLAKIVGPAIHIESKVGDDTAYRRNVEWLNDRKPISRSLARSALISRMKIQGTSASATDLLPEIEDCLAAAKLQEKPTFQRDLHHRLVQQTLIEIRAGRMDSFGFENLVKEVMKGLGATDAKVLSRSQDKGADVLATFYVAGAFQQVVAIQAKYWQPDPPVGKNVVEQLIKGIEAEDADLGMIITSGVFSDEATAAAQQYYDEKGIKIELVDGEQFAKLILERGFIIT